MSFSNCGSLLFWMFPDCSTSRCHFGISSTSALLRVGAIDLTMPWKTDSRGEPLEMMETPIGISKLPGVYFQWRTVSFREGMLLVPSAVPTLVSQFRIDLFFLVWRSYHFLPRVFFYKKPPCFWNAKCLTHVNPYWKFSSSGSKCSSVFHKSWNFTFAIRAVVSHCTITPNVGI